MTATDELRRLLDERGVEWRWEDERTTYWYVTVDGEEWGEWTAIEMGGYLHLSFSSGDVLTPAQAIAATLGTGTCHMRLAYEEEDADGCIWPDHYECDACGAKVNGIMPYYDTEVPPHFCPNCGRKVVGE